jgi:hypothetical protein
MLAWRFSKRVMSPSAYRVSREPFPSRTTKDFQMLSSEVRMRIQIAR